MTEINADTNTKPERKLDERIIEPSLTLGSDIHLLSDLLVAPLQQLPNDLLALALAVDFCSIVESQSQAVIRIPGFFDLREVGLARVPPSGVAP